METRAKQTNRPRCSHCQTPAGGFFFACPQCKPFYLCELCKGGNVHSQHVMMLVIDPTDLHGLKRLLLRTNLPPALERAIKEALASELKDKKVAELATSKQDEQQARDIQKILRKNSDTTTGYNFSTVEQKLHRGIPNFYICSHHDLCFGDTILAGNTIPSGSQYDGSAVIQEFLNIGAKRDIDILQVVTEPLSSYRQDAIIRFIPDLPVFCRLDVTHDENFRKKFPTVVYNQKSYLCASSFREFITKNGSKSALPPMILRRADDASASLTSTAGNYMPFVYPLTTLVQDKPGAAAITATVEYAGNITAVDMAFCIACEGWPSVARTPPMKGLPQRMKDLFPFGFHIVPKARVHGDTETEWRLSFSLAENALINMQWSQSDRSLYAFLKYLVKRHVGMDHVVSTYHLKTVMFWHLEKHSGNLEYGQRIVALLDTLLHFLCMENLPMYFVPQMNLWYAVPHEVLEEAARRIAALRQSLWTFPDHFQLYKEPLDSKGFESEIFYLTMHHASQQIRYDIINKKFVALGSLYKDPHTILYLWQSYLYTSTNFLNHPSDPPDTRVRKTLLSRRAQVMLVGIWRNFFEASEFGDSVLQEGSEYGEHESFDEEASSLLAKYLKVKGQEVTYFLKFDGDLFSIGIRKRECSSTQYPHPTVFPICAEEGIFYDVAIQISVSGIPSFRLTHLLPGDDDDSDD